MPTYELMQRWMSLARLEERCMSASLLTAPLWFIFRRGFVDLGAMRRDMAALWALIGNRYDGVVKQWLDRCRIPPAEAADRVMQAFKDARSSLATRQDFREVPLQMCTAMARNIGADAPAERKFVLRAFVDESPAGEARGVLKAAAFGHQAHAGLNVSGLGTAELRRLFGQACMDLHAILANCGTEIQGFTAGRITPADVKEAGQNPVATYERWLML